MALFTISQTTLAWITTTSLYFLFISTSVRHFSWSLSTNLNLVWCIAISALSIYYPLVFQHFNYSVSCYVFPFLRIFKTCYISKHFPSPRFYSRVLLYLFFTLIFYHQSDFWREWRRCSRLLWAVDFHDNFLFVSSFLNDDAWMAILNICSPPFSWQSPFISEFL